MKVEYYPNTGETILDDELSPCPFCGGKAVVSFIGNDRTKSKKVEIKCTGNCRCIMVNASLYNRYSSKKLLNIGIGYWNTREDK